MSRDPYYHSLDGYDAYQNRELLKREYKDGKVCSTYKCSNLGGEVDIFTTICDPIEKNDVNDVGSIFNYVWDNLIEICIKIFCATIILLGTISIGGLIISSLFNWNSLLSR